MELFWNPLYEIFNQSSCVVPQEEKKKDEFLLLSAEQRLWPDMVAHAFHPSYSGVYS